MLALLSLLAIACAVGGYGCATTLLRPPHSDVVSTEWRLSPRTYGPVLQPVWSIHYDGTPDPGTGRHGLAVVDWKNHPLDARVQYTYDFGPRLTLYDRREMPVHMSEQPSRSRLPTVAFSSDHETVRFSSGTRVLEWRQSDQTVTAVCTLEDDQYPVISPDGRRLAFVGEAEGGPRLYVREIDTGRAIGSHPLPSAGNRQVAFLDGSSRLLVTTCALGTRRSAWLWDPESDRTTPPVMTNGDWFFCPDAVSADGRLLAHATEDDRVQVWETDPVRFCYETGRHSHRIRRIAFSRDGRFLASGGEGVDGSKRFGEIRIWEQSTGAAVRSLTAAETWGVTALAFSPDTTQLAAGDGNGLVRFWSVPAPGE